MLAILEILYGLLMLLAAAGSFVLASVIDLEEIFRQAGMEIPQEIIDAVPFFFGMVGVVLLIMAFLAFLIAYGFLKGRGWSWTLAMVLLVLSIIFSVLSWILSGLNPAGLVSMLIGILIPVIIVIYLTRPRVKAWFGKA